MAKYKKVIKQIAKNRMVFLFNKAEEVFSQNKLLSQRYSYLAMKYSQRAKIKIPKKWKKRICHHCKSFLVPGENSRVRMQSRKGKGSHVSLTCLECNSTTRYFIKIKRD